MDVECTEEECKNKIEELIKSEKVFSYVSWWLRNEKDIKVIWKIVRSKNKVNESLYYFWRKMTHKERPIYIYHAIMNIIWED